MHIDPLVVVASLVVGFLVGTTGMGGGALMTPILVLLFGIQPLAAISSDLVSAAVMKPVGGLVHLRRGTVDARLVRWLAAGSVPAAFAGVLVAKALGKASGVQDALTVLLGTALLVATAAIVIKGLLPALRRRQPSRTGGQGDAARRPDRIALRPVATLAIGVLGGLMVGMTSVGSGSLMIVLLLVLYPTLSLSVLVGTDLVQAIPLVASAALGHLIFGDVKLGLTTSLIIGSLPGVYVGARFSSRAPDRLIRPVLAVVLFLSGLKFVGVTTIVLGWTVAAILVVAGLAWWLNLRPGPLSPAAEEEPPRGAAPTPEPRAR
ncbi:MAG TPA: sulfite exporter TauE/SafE family protein [Acidimicrobiales bacterium]